MSATQVFSYEFNVDPEMFRRTLYFNTFAKHRFQTVIMSAMFVFGIALFISNTFLHIEMSSVMQLCYIVLISSLPLMIFSCESGYRRYRSSSASVKIRKIALCDNWLKFAVIGAEGAEKLEWRQIAMAFELGDRFVIYRDADLMVLLPKSAIPAKELGEVRELLLRRLGRAFHLRN